MIEHVENLEPELGAKPLLEREVLEDGEIQVFEARVPEDIPAHRAKCSSRGRSHDRVTVSEASTRRQGAGIGSLAYAIRNKR